MREERNPCSPWLGVKSKLALTQCVWIQRAPYWLHDPTRSVSLPGETNCPSHGKGQQIWRVPWICRRRAPRLLVGARNHRRPRIPCIHSIDLRPSWMCKLCPITAERWLASKGILLKQLGRRRNGQGMSAVDPGSTISRLRLFAIHRPSLPTISRLRLFAIHRPSLSTIRSSLPSDVYTFQSPLIPKSIPLFLTYNTWLSTQGIPHGICLS